MSALPTPPEPFLPNLRDRWMLKEGIAFLNHGSFGATPRVVFEEQDRWRRRLEAEPVELLGRRQSELVEAAKRPVGGLLRMATADFGLVTNATEGINAVLHSLAFEPGDDLVTTTHVYNAVRQAMEHTAARHGAVYRELDVPTPIRDPEQIARAIVSKLTDRSRLLVIDHVTSPTGLIFPVEAIVAACAGRGVDVLIDGAHAPGMLDLDVPAIGAAYYAGNLHKWCCAPKGCGFLWVAPRLQKQIHPCIVSHNYGQGIAAEFGWQGTRDGSAWLTLPAALAFMADLGWERVRRYDHDLAVWAHATLCERFGVEPLTPLDGSLLGSTATVLLPPPLAAMNDADAKALQQSLYTEDGIEIPLFPWQGKWHLRVSCQAYNVPAEYQRLAQVILRRAVRRGT
jgi:isopenicillin-N epimerase